MATIADVIIGPAALWIAATGEAEPDETTVTYGASWGGNWSNMGWTTGPVTLSRNTDTFRLEVEQVTSAVKEVVVSEDVMIETVLAEQSKENMAKLLNGTASSVAAGASQRGYDQVVAGGSSSLTQYTVGFEGLYEDSSQNQFPVRLFLYIATVELNGQVSFTKSDAAGTPVVFKALADTSKTAGQQIMKWLKVTTEATS